MVVEVVLVVGVVLVAEVKVVLGIGAVLVVLWTSRHLLVSAILCRLSGSTFFDIMTCPLAEDAEFVSAVC